MLRSIKSKLNNKESLKQACSTAIDGLQTTLRIVEKTTGDTGVPRLQAGLGGLVFILDAIKKTSQNVKDIETLSEQIAQLNQVLGNFKDGKKPSAEVIERIDRLFGPSNAALEELRKIVPHSPIKRIFQHDDDARLISGHIQSITSSFQSFTVETMLAVESAVDAHAAQAEQKIDDLHDPIQEVKLLNIMKDILGQIFDWIATKDPQPRIFWIKGGAGTGKTTIAYTVSEVCRTSGILGASFFCSRDDVDCSNPRLIFTSIACELGKFNVFFRAEVSRAMEANPDIGYLDTSYQLEQLIVKPLRTLGRSFSPRRSCIGRA